MRRDEAVSSGQTRDSPTHPTFLPLQIKQQEQRRRELDFLLAAFVSEAASAVR